MRIYSEFEYRGTSFLVALFLLISGFQAVTVGIAQNAAAADLLTWTESTVPKVSYSLYGIAANSDGTRVFVGAQKGGFLSTNSGTSWSEIAALNNVNSSGYQVGVGMSLDGTKMYYAFNNKVYYSWDSGTTWSNTTTNSSNKEIWSISTSYDGTKILATTRDGGLYSYSTDSGQSWTVVNDSYGGGWAGAISGDGTKIIIAERNSKSRATGSGIPRMGPIAGPLTAIAAGGAGNGFDAINTSSYNDWRGAACDATCTHIVLSNAQGGLYTSSDSGATWVVGASTYSTNFKNLVFGAASTTPDGSRISASVTWDLGTGTYISTDYGVNWTYQNSATGADGTFVTNTGNAVYSMSSGPSTNTTIKRGVFQTATSTTLQFEKLPV